MDKIQSFCEKVGKWGCLAFCYLECVGITDDIQKLVYIQKAIKEKIIDNEMEVLDANKLLALTGKKYTVNKVAITKQSELDKIKDPTPVRYDYGNASHWVVVKEGKIIYNSLTNSVCVNKGFATTSRPISSN